MKELERQLESERARGSQREPEGARGSLRETKGKLEGTRVIHRESRKSHRELEQSPSEPQSARESLREPQR